MIEEKLKVQGQQLEIQQHLSFEPGAKQIRYRIETYIFSPVSLQINGENYKATDCLRFFKNFIRLRPPSIDLEHFANGSVVSDHLSEALTELEKLPTELALERFLQVNKLFALTYKRSLRLKTHNLYDELDLQDSEARHYVELIQKALDVYRLQAKRLREIGKTIGSECDVFCDEFMSVITLYYLQKMIVRIQRESSKNILLSLWESENRYRKEHHQESFSEQSSQEQQLYRWRLLTKYVSSCLFLNIKPHVGPTFLVHSLYGFAAAVSMIFATVIAFAWQGQYGALSANLFIALVIGYIFKDRIKDLLKEQLSKRFKKWIPDRRLEILRDERYHVGDCKESFEFFDVRRLPEPVRRLRQRAQSVKGIYDWRFESILLYKKELTVKTDPALFRDTRYGLMDTTWFNLMPFLNFIDTDEADLPVADDSSMHISQADKIYHLYFVRRLFTLTADKRESVKDEIIRVVLTNKGINSMKTLDI